MGKSAPAAATLGAIITLGAFMPAPSVAPPEPPTVAAAPEVQGSVETRLKVDVDRPAEQETERARGSRPALVAQAPGSTTAAASTTRVEDIVLGDELSRSQRDPHPVPPKPDTEPVAQPATPSPDETDDDSDSCVEEEGQQNGKGHEKAKGEGHSKHCD